MRGGARGFGGIPRRLVSLWRAGGEEVGLEGLREGAVGLWEGGLSRAMPSRSEGRRTFVGLTVHGRMEGGPESRLQSSPAEGLTVTGAEAGGRGEASARWTCSRRMCGGVYEVALNNLSLIYLIDGPLPVSSISLSLYLVSPIS